jgi:hypothetical protein
MAAHAVPGGARDRRAVRSRAGRSIPHLGGFAVIGAQDDKPPPEGDRRIDLRQRPSVSLVVQPLGASPVTTTWSSIRTEPSLR